MAVDRVRIDGKTYILAPGQDVGELKAAIETAARSGAGFVDFRAVGGHTVSVLISPGVSVRMESTEEHPDAASAPEGAVPLVCDPDDSTDFYDV